MPQPLPRRAGGRSRRRFWIGTAISLAVLATVLGLALLPAIPWLARQRMIHDLTSADRARRHAALRYLAAHAGRDGPLVAAAVGRLDRADEAAFLGIAGSLDMAGRWGRDTVPDGPWLRWIAIQLSDPSPPARVAALSLLADLPQLADDARLVALLTKAAGDADPTVRYNTLVTAAGLAGAAHQPGNYETLIAGFRQDAAPPIARQAWIILALFNPVSGLNTSWRDPNPDLAAVKLWAAIYTHPDQPRPAIEALDDESLDPSVRAMAAYALSMSVAATTRPDTSQASAVLLRFIDDHPADKLPPKMMPVLARAILATPPIKDAGARRPTVGDYQWQVIAGAIEGLKPNLAPDDPAVLVALAASYRLGRPFEFAGGGTPRRVRVFDEPGAIERLDRPADTRPAMFPSPAEVPVYRVAIDPASQPATRSILHDLAEVSGARLLSPKQLADLADLARLTALAGGTQPQTQPQTQPGIDLLPALARLAATEGQAAVPAPADDANLGELERLALAQRISQLDPMFLWPLLRSPYSALRDGAYLVAATRLSPAQQTDLAAALLRDFDDEAKKSGAMLIGLTGVAPPMRSDPKGDLLLWHYQREDNRAVRQTMRLGLWMAGRLPAQDRDDLVPVLPALAETPDMPRTSVLLAMLHQGDARALDILLNPRGELRYDLIELLDSLRWVNVLYHYFPPDPREAPPFWVWADTDLQRFQLEVLRNWYLVHRSRALRQK